MRIERYTPERAQAWDAFVRSSRNGTFLFERGYMDYHADRFRDHSLLVFSDGGELVALLPANEAGKELASHGGLTYGGFVVGARMTIPAMFDAFTAVVGHARDSGFLTIGYKPVPYIYHAYPSQEDLFALGRQASEVYRRDVLSVAIPGRTLPWQERRRRKMKQAQKAGVRISASEDWGSFWNILEANLARSHGARPVHSLGEITLLARRFPSNIRLHLATAADETLAGVVIYDTGRVGKAQYIGSSDQGREVGALDLLFSVLLEGDYAQRDYFDFGSSNGTDGTLNLGLIEQKEGFGARAVVQEFHRIGLA